MVPISFSRMALLAPCALSTLSSLIHRCSHLFTWYVRFFFYHNATFFNPFLFKKNFKVRFDTRGHGRSGKPLTPDFYTSDRYADDLKAIIEGFKLIKPFFAGWQVDVPISSPMRLTKGDTGA